MVCRMPWARRRVGFSTHGMFACGYCKTGPFDRCRKPNSPAAERYSFRLRPSKNQTKKNCYSPVSSLDLASIDSLYIEAMKKADLLPGTLDMLVLKTLTRAPLHGYGIAQSIRRFSDDVLTVEEGSLYPALQRLLLQGWVKAEWKITETNRRARFYTLTAAGRKQLGIEVSQFELMISAITRVLSDAQEA